MEVNERYKNTIVEDLPNNWIYKSIADISIDMIQGVNTAIDIPEYVSYGIPMLKANNIIDGEISFTSIDYISRKTYNTYNDRFKPQINDFLFSNIGARLGTGSLLKSNLKCSFAWNVMRIIPNTKVISPEFLKCSINSRYFYKLIISNLFGSGMGFIPKNVLSKLQIPLPPLPEQQAIAEVLTDTENLIQALEKQIAKKKLIKQGVMQQLLTPKEGWEVKTLKDIGVTYGGLSGKSKNDFEGGSCPYIPFMNIMSNPIIDVNYFNYVNIKSAEKQNTAQKGDLFFNGSSETPEEVGMCSVLLEDVPNLYLNSFCFGFRLNDLDNFNSLYITYFFRSSEGRKLLYSLAQGATRYNLSKSNFLKLKIACPPIADQVIISNIIKNIDLDISKWQTKIEKTKLIRNGLMQQLLTGKIRLIES